MRIQARSAVLAEHIGLLIHGQGKRDLPAVAHPLDKINKTGCQ